MNRQHRKFCRFFLLVCTIFFVDGIFLHSSARTAGQNRTKSKPGWFWNQPVTCGMTAVGVSRHSVLYPENSKKVAHEKGVHAYLRQSESHHSGGIAFSITERGAVWLGGDQTETYDESRLEDYLENLEILDYQVSGNLCMVLVGPETCRDDVDNRSHSYPLLHRPAWVDETPSNHGFIYAAGVSEGYYYSVSSWDLAEKMAHRNLSASIQSRIQGLHDQATGTSHEILYSDQKVTLNFAVVTSRYHDPATNLYYVLVRMPIR